MKRAAAAVLAGYLSVCALPAAHASDACSAIAIRTTANVTVSDGDAYRTETFFQSVDAAAIRFIAETDRIVAIDGPLAWFSGESGAEIGSDVHGQIALGHQFHAFLLHWDDIVADGRASAGVDFRGEARNATSGDLPRGGRAHRIGEPGRPDGLVFELPEDLRIDVSFDDWRETPGGAMPYRIDIDDGDRSFTYRYESIELADATPLWYMDAVAAPAIDEVLVYRLHRKLLAAHCLGDADMMADLAAPEALVASRGELLTVPREEVRTRFRGTFERWDYGAYRDLVPPVIEVSADAGIGWIGVNVRAEGVSRADGTAFADQWAWVMLVRRIDGAWLNAGNASNRRDD